MGGIGTPTSAACSMPLRRPGSRSLSGSPTGCTTKHTKVPTHSACWPRRTVATIEAVETGAVRGRRWQVTAWPSTKPSRRLGPGRVSGPPPDRPGMQPFPAELEPPEADRAPETIAASTDNRPNGADRQLWPVGPAPQPHQNERGSTGNHGESAPSPARLDADRSARSAREPAAMTAASQAESASSMLVTRSRIKPQVSGLGLVHWRGFSAGDLSVDARRSGTWRARVLGGHDRLTASDPERYRRPAVSLCRPHWPRL